MNELQDKTLLVVDDDEAMLRAMTKVLSGAGCRVTSVADPVAALNELANPNKHFDLLITDLRMPVFSGRGVMGFANAALPEMPVIIITAYGGPEVEAQALRGGAFAFLEKPIDAAQLLEVARRALASPTVREG